MRTFILAFLASLSLTAFAANPNYNGAKNQTIYPGTGPFSGGYFGNLRNVVVDLRGVNFTGTITFDNDSNVTVLGGNFGNIFSSGVLLNGNNFRVHFDGQSFQNVTGTVYNCSSNAKYDGSQASLKLQYTSFVNQRVVGCGQFFQGSWGNMYPDLVDFMDSITFKTVDIKETRSNGTQIKGTIFRGLFDGVSSTYTINGGINPILGDVGMIYFNGDGTIKNCYMNGGRGYILRLWVGGLNRTPQVYYLNNRKLNTTTYGGAEIRLEKNQIFSWIKGGGHAECFNNTSYNTQDNIGYWSPVINIGQCDLGFYVIAKNNLAVKVTTSGNADQLGKAKTVTDASNGTNKGDTTGNYYFPQPDGILNTSTGFKVSDNILPGIGATVTGTTTPPVVVPPVGTCDSAAIIAAYLKANPCPTVVCPVCPSPTKQRTAVAIGFAGGGTITIQYDDGTYTNL